MRRSRGVLDRAVKPGDDSGVFGARRGDEWTATILTLPAAA